MATLKLKVLPQFPSRVVAGDGIVITKTNGIYTISVDTDTPVSPFLLNPTSANLLAAITDETGTGVAVFNRQPSFDTDIRIGVAAASAFYIVDPATQTFPVPTFRPTSSNKNIALDIMPNGSPAAAGANGYAWLDICDIDLVASPSGAVRVAHVGITATAAVFGSAAYNFGASTPVEFAVDGTSKVVLNASSLSPAASDGVALGTSSLMYSDLFLASGAVVNFNAGDVTLTHSSNLLTVGGGNLTVSATQNTQTFVSAVNASNGTAAQAALVATNDTASGTFGVASSGSSNALAANRAFISSDSALSGILISTGGSDPIVFAVNSAEVGRFGTTAGQFTLGLAGTSAGTLILSGNTSGTTTISPAAAASGTWSLPAATDTFVGKATSDALTNKSVNGLTISTTTGTLTIANSTTFSYSHGNWTPTLVGSSTAGTGQTYSTQHGTYEIIGRICNVRFFVQATSLGTAAGNMRVGGLPFTAANVAAENASGVAGVYTAAGLAATNYGLTILVSSNTDFIQILQSGNTTSTLLTVAQAGASFLIEGSISYRIS